MDLTNASAIVTGCAVGSATVSRLALKGAKVVIADVHPGAASAKVQWR